MFVFGIRFDFDTILDFGKIILFVFINFGCKNDSWIGAPKRFLLASLYLMGSSICFSSLVEEEGSASLRPNTVSKTVNQILPTRIIEIRFNFVFGPTLTSC